MANLVSKIREWYSYLKSHITWNWCPFFSNSSLQGCWISGWWYSNIKTCFCFRWLQIHDETLMGRKRVFVGHFILPKKHISIRTITAWLQFPCYTDSNVVLLFFLLISVVLKFIYFLHNFKTWSLSSYKTWFYHIPTNIPIKLDFYRPHK